MTYTCLGNDDYEIKLTIFRDCYNGNPNAWFDNPAAIGVFDSNNNLLDTIFIEWDSELNDTLDPVLSDSCFVAPPDVCVHTTTYVTIANLPVIAGGYQLAYQRCCRNVTIANLINPLDVGATFGVTISETALQECNSSAQFGVWPPVYICVNEPINFDQSGFDIDGDSIVYKLCTPLNGASPDDPIPQPPGNPPYDDVPWLDPPYSVNNMLNGSPGGVPFTIDSETGLLTGTPNTTGQFVVGVCIDEYRNNQLISTTRRDFQYNVGVCGMATSAFFAPEIQCDGFTVDFENNSEGAESFEWYFNDPQNPGLTSTLENPSHMYSDTGLYTIMLIAEPNSSCVDTSYQSIQLYEDSLFPEFEVEYVDCSDSVTIQVADMTIDTLSEPEIWNWEFLTDLGLSFTFDEQNPTFIAIRDYFISNEGTIFINLTVTAANGCEKTFSQNIDVFFLEEELIADSLQLCFGDSVALNPGQPVVGAIYSWSPIEGLSDPNIPNPTATPSETITYTATISNANCDIERSITLNVPPKLQAELPNDTTTCQETVQLFAETNFGTQFFWATDPDFGDIISTEQELLITPYGDTTLYVMVRDSVGCSAIDTVSITGNGVNASISTSPIICLGETTALEAVNTDPTDILIYSWSPTDDILAGENTSQVVIQPTMPGVEIYYVEMENQHGCTKIDSTELGTVDTLEQAGFVSFQQCGGFSIHFTNTSVNANFYNWDFGDPNNPNSTSTEANPVYTYSEVGTYLVTLTLPENVECPDTIQEEITVGVPQIEVDFEWEFDECSDSTTIAFTDLSVNAQSTIENWNWEFSNGETADIQNPMVTLFESQTLEILLEVASSDGCLDTLIQNIEINLIDVNLVDTVGVCNNDPIPLNPNPNITYEYEWSPATGLDDATSPNPLANPSETTTYTVTITDFSEDTCQIIRSITAFIPPLLELAVPTDTIVCEDDISLAAISNNAISFEWSSDPSFGNIIGNTNQINATVEDSEIFYIRVEDAYGCQLTEEVLVENQKIEVQIVDTLEICINDTLQVFAINLNPTQTLTYSWSPTSAILEGENSNSPILQPTENTNLMVDISNEFGCTATDSVQINTFDNFVPIDIIPEIDTIYEGDSILLLATFDPFYQYFWSPVESLDFPSADFNPFAHPLETTTYTVVVRDPDGCTNSDESTIIVLERICDEPFIFVPTGFTPNYDGKNDYFEVFSNHIDEMELIVYNRWGEKVFESFKQEEKWDGTLNGVELPADVFGFYLSVRCIGGERFVKKGNVTLIR